MVKHNSSNSNLFSTMATSVWPPIAPAELNIEEDRSVVRNGGYLKFEAHLTEHCLGTRTGMAT